LSVNHKNQQLQSAFVIIEEKNKKGEKRGKTGKKREKKTGKREKTEEANRSSSHPKTENNEKKRKKPTAHPRILSSFNSISRNVTSK